MNKEAQQLRMAGYVRVSTSKQDVGPEVQAAALHAAAAAAGWSLTIYREEAASAGSMRNRPVLAKALADLKAGRLDALAVSKLDRLSRSVADFAAMLETANRQRWALIALDLGIDTSTVIGTAMAQVTAVFAQMERSRIAERTRAAMATIRKEKPDKVMGRQSALPTTTIQRIRTLRASGMSLARIAADLEAAAIPTATGGRWYASTVLNILNRKTATQEII